MYSLHGMFEQYLYLCLKGEINYTMWVSNWVDEGQGGEINVHRNAWALSLGLGSRIGLDHLQQGCMRFSFALCAGVDLGRVACGGRYVFHIGLMMFVSLV